MHRVNGPGRTMEMGGYSTWKPCGGCVGMYMKLTTVDSTWVSDVIHMYNSFL